MTEQQEGWSAWRVYRFTPDTGDLTCVGFQTADDEPALDVVAWSMYPPAESAITNESGSMSWPSVGDLPSGDFIMTWAAIDYDAEPADINRDRYSVDYIEQSLEADGFTAEDISDRPHP